MAVIPNPPNIVPGTTAVPYGAVSLSGAPVYVPQKNFSYLTIVGARSRAYVDDPYYNGTSYRNTLDAGFLGRSQPSVLEYVQPDAFSAPVPPYTYGNGDETLFVMENTSVTPLVDLVTQSFQKSDQYTGQPPWQQVFAGTVVRWYDGPVVANLPTGNMVGECPRPIYRGSSGAIPQIYGSVPPAYTPPVTP